MLRLRHEARVRPVLKLAAIAAFIVYCFWNGFWLARGQLPPSIWSSLTGLPCPTSGVTRSVRALVAGECSASLLYNPFTIPFALLLAYSAYRLVWSWRARHEFVLPASVGRLWLVAILGAWLAKFLIGPAYW